MNIILKHSYVGSRARRYAKSQRDQLLGQALGLPLSMALFSALGLAVTSATVVIFGRAIIDPVQILGQLQHPAAIVLSLFGLMLATLTTNIAANVVAPANAIVNVAPKKISFRTGALVRFRRRSVLNSRPGNCWSWLILMSLHKVLCLVRLCHTSACELQ